jgi:hypothetical protein
MRQLIVTTGIALIAFGCSSEQQAPSFAYQEQSGCGDLVTTAWNRSLTEVLAVHADRSRLDIRPNTTTVFDLGQRRDGLRVEIHVYASDKHNWPCSDVLTIGAEEPRIWRAAKGHLSLTVGETSAESWRYLVNVELTHASFAAPDGREVQMPRTIRFTTTAGTGPGG